MIAHVISCGHLRTLGVGRLDPTWMDLPGQLSGNEPLGQPHLPGERVSGRCCGWFSFLKNTFKLPSIYLCDVAVRGQLAGVGSVLHHVGSEDGTEFLSLVGQHLYPLSLLSYHANLDSRLCSPWSEPCSRLSFWFKNLCVLSLRSQPLLRTISYPEEE